MVLIPCLAVYVHHSIILSTAQTPYRQNNYPHCTENGSVLTVLKHEIPTGKGTGSTNLLITLSYASVTIFSFVNGSNAS